LQQLFSTIGAAAATNAVEKFADACVVSGWQQSEVRSAQLCAWVRRLPAMAQVEGIDK